jgi:signal recognition particle receptor subunit beta
MVLFNYSTRELTAKIVYYGPGLCGKTTNLQYIYDNLPGNTRGKMLSLATKTDRTLFFDFLPIDLGEIRGMKTRIQLYTVPGQVFYNETRRLVLKGADGVVFVADSQKQMLDANLDSFRNLEENLKAHGIKLPDIPLVVQFNKRDLPNVASIEELSTALNKYNAPFYESVATTGIGVQDTLKAITKLVLVHLTKKYDVRRPAAVAMAEAAASKSAAAKTGKGAKRRGGKAASRRGGSKKRVPVSPVEEPDQPAIAARGPAEPVSPAAMPAAASSQAGPMAAGALADGEEVVDLVDVVEEAPTPLLHEVTDEAELIASEQVSQIEAMAPAETPEGSRAAPSDGRAVHVPVQGPGSPEQPAVSLTEVNEEEELFAPGSPVAHVEGDRATEVVVPVEVRLGEDTRRFRLTVRLSVDALDKGR